MVTDQDRVPDPLLDASRPSAGHLQTLPILHDGDPSTAEDNKGSLLDEWEDDSETPELHLQMAPVVDPVLVDKVKVLLLDRYVLIVRNFPTIVALPNEKSLTG